MNFYIEVIFKTGVIKRDNYEVELIFKTKILKNNNDNL